MKMGWDFAAVQASRFLLIPEHLSEAREWFSPVSFKGTHVTSSEWLPINAWAEGGSFEKPVCWNLCRYLAPKVSVSFVCFLGLQWKAKLQRGADADSCHNSRRSEVWLSELWTSPGTHLKKRSHGIRLYRLLHSSYFCQILEQSFVPSCQC